MSKFRKAQSQNLLKRFSANMEIFNINFERFFTISFAPLMSWWKPAAICQYFIYYNSMYYLQISFL